MIAAWMLYALAAALLATVAAASVDRALRLLGRACRPAWVGAMLLTQLVSDRGLGRDELERMRRLLDERLEENGDAGPRRDGGDR